MRPVLRLALHNLRRFWLRGCLSALAVAFGVATLVAADLISQSITEEIAHSAEAEAVTAFMSEQMNVGLTVVGLVVTAGAGFLTFNAFAMAVSQRREDLGRLRAVGMTRRQVLAMVLAEAGVIGLVGAALGLAGGVALSRGLIALVESTSEMYNRFGQAPVSGLRLLWAGGFGLATALLAALIPALRAAGTSPLAARRLSPLPGVGRASSRLALAASLIAAAMWVFLALDPPGHWILPPWANLLSALLAVLWLVLLALSVPAQIDLAGRGLRRPLGRILGVPGRLAADNLRRARGRVTFTLLTLAVGAAMIVGVTGFLTYWFEELYFRGADRSLRENPGVGFFPIDINAGLQAYQGVARFTMPEGFREQVEDVVAGRAVVVETYFVIVPELSFMGERYFSYVLDPRSIRESGDLLFSFTYGNWDRALEIADRGCALLLTPTVARKNNAWLEDVITLQTPLGRMDCTVAGVGPTFAGASIISDAGLTAYHLVAPVSLTVFTRSEADREALLPALQALADRTPGVWLIDLALIPKMQRQGMQAVRTLMDGMLLLAMLSAGLGVVNTALIGLAERRSEFGILRAAGASRGQVQAVVFTEGLVMGFLGAMIGILAGAGLVVLYVVISAGSPFGYADFPVWPAALDSVRPALGRGLLAAIAMPALSALAAWLPVRRSLTGPVRESLGGAGRGW
jgi:putative ABC transport system permease protein